MTSKYQMWNTEILNLKIISIKDVNKTPIVCSG